MNRNPTHQILNRYLQSYQQIKEFVEKNDQARWVRFLLLGNGYGIRASGICARQGPPVPQNILFAQIRAQCFSFTGKWLCDSRFKI